MGTQNSGLKQIQHAEVYDGTNSANDSKFDETLNFFGLSAKTQAELNDGLIQHAKR